MRALRAHGYEVTGVSPHDSYADRLVDSGFAHVQIEMRRQGKHPLEDLGLLVRLVGLLRDERPDLLLTYTAKPTIYGSLAARATGIPVINTIPGIGALASSSKLLSVVVRSFYRIALRRSRAVLFQNDEDQSYFLRYGLVVPSQAGRVAGSGVDTGRFSPAPVTRESGPPVFLHVSRLLWTKGVGLFVEAARILRKRGFEVDCRVLGFYDPAHPNSISTDQVSRWEGEGLIRYLGGTDDVAPFMTQADCVVLASYYGEGVPRSLLEAASLAKPLIAADVPGSRDVVRHNVTGLLCEPENAHDLAAKMETVVSLDEQSRIRLGSAARARVCQEFDENLVIERYLHEVSQHLNT